MGASSKASGTILCWADGLPSKSVNNGTLNDGSMTYWADGLPGAGLYITPTYTVIGGSAMLFNCTIY